MLFHSFLLADVGNTRVKLATSPIPARGFAPKGAPTKIQLKEELATTDFTAETAHSLRKKYQGHFLVFSSVVPKIAPVLLIAFKRGVHQVTAKASPLGYRFAYPNPAELGADRIAAAAAAHAEELFPAIIIACGTATAFTVLDANGRLCGGAIAPGLQAQLDALVGATAQLPSPALREPRNALAKSTRDAIRAGVVLGFQGGIKEIVLRLGESFPRSTKPHIIVTGGNAKLAATALTGRVTLRPLLVLEGLHIIGARLAATAK